MPSADRKKNAETHLAGGADILAQFMEHGEPLMALHWELRGDVYIRQSMRRHQAPEGQPAAVSVYQVVQISAHDEPGVVVGYIGGVPGRFKGNDDEARLRHADRVLKGLGWSLGKRPPLAKGGTIENPVPGFD